MRTMREMCCERYAADFRLTERHRKSLEPEDHSSRLHQSYRPMSSLGQCGVFVSLAVYKFWSDFEVAAETPHWPRELIGRYDLM